MNMNDMEQCMPYVRRNITAEDQKELREIKTAFKDYLLRKINTDPGLLEMTDGVRVFERLVVTLSMC